MRGRFISTVIYIALALIISALFYIQVIRFPYYSRLARNNSIRIIPIDGPRGIMFDRNGLAVVTSRISFDVSVIYQELKEKDKLIDNLERIAGIPPQQSMSGINDASKKPYAPFKIAEDIGKEKAIALEESCADIRGFMVETEPMRFYPHKDSGAHIFGYLSEINELELEMLKGYGYRVKDMVGRDGLEKYYDVYLKGEDGGTQIEVDSRGQQIRVMGIKEPSSGKDLYLSIDMQLQDNADKLLGARGGAVIVMDPRNGDMLALASHPAFDPNVFVKPNTQSKRLDLIGNRSARPLMDRAISGVYSPGSVFKSVVAIAALQTRKISPSTTFFCPGHFNLGGATFNCWKKEGHGTQNVVNALMNSCNVFFYNTGRAVGVDAIEAFAKYFGYGKQTGIDLPEEVKGVVPGKLWKRITKKDHWYEGDTINFSIGQGYLLVTPIQVAEMTSIIANGGNFVKPRLVTKIGPDDSLSPVIKSVNIDGSALNKVKEGLFKVINDESGTGKRAKLSNVFIAGKTGTAQNPQGRTHAWFAGFAPYSNPKVCVVVFLEHGGRGGAEPAEIARDIFSKCKELGYL